MVKYYKTHAKSILALLRKIGHKSIIQINEFLLSGYIVHSDPSMAIVKDKKCIYTIYF